MNTVFGPVEAEDDICSPVERLTVSVVLVSSAGEDSVVVSSCVDVCDVLVGK